MNKGLRHRYWYNTYKQIDFYNSQKSWRLKGRNEPITSRSGWEDGYKYCTFRQDRKSVSILAAYYQNPIRTDWAKRLKNGLFRLYPIGAIKKTDCLDPKGSILVYIWMAGSRGHWLSQYLIKLLICVTSQNDVKDSSTEKNDHSPLSVQLMTHHQKTSTNTALWQSLFRGHPV